jgi:hypothetical protein
MPDKKTIQRAQRDEKQGKSAGTQAGEFVHAEIDKIRKGEHGVRNPKQAIAIGLSEARRAGVDLKSPKKGSVSEQTRKNAQRESEKGRKHEPVSPTRSRARVLALKKESTKAASHEALSKQTSSAAKKRPASDRSAAARQAAEIKNKNKVL